MDQNIRNKGGKISAVLLLFVGLMLLPLAISILLFASDTTIILIGIVLLVCSIMIIYGAVQQFIKSKKQSKHYSQVLDEIQIQQSKTNQISVSKSNNIPTILAPKIHPLETKILAHWKYSKEEWRKFISWETKERKTNIFFESFAIVLIGIPFLMFFRDADFMVSFLVCLVIASIYGFIKYRLHLKGFNTIFKENEVIITLPAIVINGSYQVMQSDEIWLSKINIKKDNGLNIMEFVYNWNTRKGNTFDEIRIPIPFDKLQEAEEIKNQILNPSL